MPPPNPPQVVELSQQDRELLAMLAAAAERIAASLEVIADRWLNTTGG